MRMMKIMLTGVGILVSCAVFSQKDELYRLPKITIEDLQENKSKITPDAPAEILYKSLHQIVHTNLQIETIYVERLKIYDKTKAANYLDKEYSYGLETNISDFKAITYNLESNKIQESAVDKKSRFTSKENSDYIKESFAFENVKDGAIVEFSYKASNDNYTYYFGIESNLPARKIQYLLEVPENLDFTVRPLGNLKIDNKKLESRNMYSTTYKRYLYQYKNVDAYLEENYVKNIRNYRAGIHTEFAGASTIGNYNLGISTTWDDVARTFLLSDDYGKVLEKYKDLKGIKDSFTHIASQEQRAKDILKYITTNYEWNGESSSKARDFSKFLQQKKGNSTELNLLLLLLLKKNKIEAHTVLASTINNGVLLAHLPSSKKPNYTLVAATINDSMVLMDATSKYTRINVVHPRALSYMGLLIKDKKGNIINFSPMPSTQVRKAVININEDGEVSGEINEKFDNVYAILEHESYDKDKETYLKRNETKWQVALNDTKVSHSDEGIFEMNNKFLSENDVVLNAKKIIVNPLFFLKEVYKFNQTYPRRSPIEFISGFKDVIDIEINLPAGYTLEKPFRPAKMKTDDGSISFDYSIVQSGSKLIVKSTVMVEEDTYDKEFYPIFKQVFDYINKIHNESISIIKS